MFGFVTDLYNSLTGNSGSSSAKDSAMDALKAATTTRAGSNPAAGANNASGYNTAATGGGGIQAGQTDEDMRRVTLQGQKPQKVGTTVNDKNPINGETPPDFKGFPSLFNPYYLVRYHAHMNPVADGESSKYITDLNTAEGEIQYTGLANGPEYKNPSTALIVNKFAYNEAKPEQKYSYSDFLYLKHYHPFNNNRLITLRRFMAPVYDELRIAIKDVGDEKWLRKPIAQALTYLDTSGNKFSNFSKMNVTINTNETKGALDNVVTLLDVEKEQLGKTESSSANIGTKLLSLLTNPKQDGSIDSSWNSTYDPWKNGPLQDLVYGPVNVITGSVIRGRGLKFSQPNFRINFEYSSKSIENVNQKAAMLDILANMLALTYNHALFWGGENRYLIERKNFPLVRAEVMFSLLKDINNPQATFDGIVKQLGLSASKLVENASELFSSALTEGSQALKPETQGAQGNAEEEKKKANLQNTAQQILQKDSKVLQKLQRSILEGTKAELTGAPTGEWHLQVGNPFAPIMMIGNLWCTTTDFEFNDELSIDDFPTELKVTCTLKHGRERDASDIQSIFNGGGGRIYYPYSNAEVDVNASYSTHNSESYSTTKSDEVKNSDGRVSVDRSGNPIDNLVKIKKKEQNTVNTVKSQIFQPIKTKLP